MNKEEELFQKRMLDLANQADMRNMITYSDFMNLNELNIFHSCAKELSFVKRQLFGGYEFAERQIAAFVPDALSYIYETEEEIQNTFPIVCIKIVPLHEKYAEALTHRDYLGAILNLGIDRSTIGDILVDGTTAYVFCLEQMADYLCKELTRVRHTTVNCIPMELQKMDYQPKYELIKGSVASVRLDTLLSLAFGSSRSKLTELIEAGKVFVNGKLVTSNGYKIKEQDIISARGLGRFRYIGNATSTRKGRLFVEIEKYV